jgi:hypothetical protein
LAAKERKERREIPCICKRFAGSIATKPLRSFAADNWRGLLAEMFSTTAVASTNVSDDHRVSIPLKSGELIVWDQSTAWLKNPRLMTVFGEKSPDQPSQHFAGGAPIRGGQPTKTRLNFSWAIGEPNCDTSSVRFE